MLEQSLGVSPATNLKITPRLMIALGLVAVILLTLSMV
jgi:preprotein translocase subunit Sec61beta